ncbi:MAG: glycosyltransferase family 4 protein [Planctomycetota bacterium]
MARILHISTRLILGGSQENTVLSCEGQVGRGHDVHLAFGPIYGPEGSMLERVVRTPAIHTHDVPNLVREIAPLRDRRCLYELRALIRRLKPDIVHTHSSKAGILGRAAAWAEGGSVGGIGVVHTIHGPPFMPIEGGIAKRTSVRLKNHIYTLAERYAAKRSHVIASVADAMTETFLRRGIGDPAQYVTVYSGMEIAPFVDPTPGETRAEVRQRHGIAPDDVVIGTVARLAEHKGHDDVLDAIGERLRAQPSLKLLWVGDGWWRERLLRRVAQMGLTDKVVLSGLVPPEQVPGLMRAMDVLVHPSYREGLPRTVPQALLSGTAVVAYDVDGTGEACIDRNTGRLVPVGDTDALRDAIEWMLADADRRAGTVEAGRGLCLERFDAERMVDALDDVYTRARGAAPVSGVHDGTDSHAG